MLNFRLNLSHFDPDFGYLIVYVVCQAAVVVSQVALKPLDLRLQRIDEIVLKRSKRLGVGLLMSVFHLLQLELEEGQALLMGAHYRLKVFYGLWVLYRF